MTYTHTRITEEYRTKLRAQAKRNKRSAMKHLEILIDGEEARARRKHKQDQQEV